MIDVIQPFGKLEYIINLYQRDSKQLCHDMNVPEEDLLAVIQECFNIELFKEKFKQEILNQHSLSQLSDFEKSNALKVLNSFELDAINFEDVRIRINPYAKFLNSSFIFGICDGEKINGTKHIGCYCFIPKMIATNQLRIDEYPIYGPLNFLVTVKEYGRPFTISQLMVKSKNTNFELLIRRIKKMLLCQLLLIE